jgi:ankyrin repeat protein
MINQETMLEIEQLLCAVSMSNSAFVEFQNCITSNPSYILDCDESGTTLLVTAAFVGCSVAVDFLSKSGADCNAINESGDTPLLAVIRGSTSSKTATNKEIQERELCLQYLVHHGAKPDHLAYAGCNSLHWAVISGHVDYVRKLLELGANPFERLNDPPSKETPIELVSSSRFRGTESQRSQIGKLFETHINQSVTS